MSLARRSSPSGARILLAALAAIAASSAALAGPRDILFWAPYAAGSPEQAAETMQEFARYVEEAAGWPSGSAGAAYRNGVEDGRRAVQEQEPGFLVVPMPIWLRHHEALDWRPLLTLVTDASEAQRYSVYGPAGASLDSLAGAPLAGDTAYDAAFVSGVVLARGEEDLPFRLEPTSRPLSALRRAARGEEVLVLLDEAQRLALDSLPKAMEIHLLAESPWMPAGVVVAGPGAAPEDVEALTAALQRAADDDGAAEILNTMKIRRFDPVADDDLAALGRSYASARKGAGAGGSAG